MATTYTLIEAQTLTSNAASVTFSSIPATYTDLVVRFSARGDNEGGVNGTLKIEFNGDTAIADYDSILLLGNGSAAQSSINTEKILIQMSGQTANGFGSGEIYVPSYLSSAIKPVSAFGVSESNTAAVDMRATAGLYNKTTAISSIAIKQNSGTNFVTGSSFYLYGISNA